MSRSFHSARRWGKLKRENYYIFCTRPLRNKNKQMLRNYVHVCNKDELDDKLYHASKNEVYDSWTWD